METVRVQLEHCEYLIHVGGGLYRSSETLAVLGSIISGEKCVIVTDSNVGPLYGDLLAELLEQAGAAQVYSTVFPAGETSKSLSTLEDLYHFGVSCGLDRRSVVFALGGGVTGDLAGFFAATFMRGVRLIQVPTSLLAFVDSSVGGKVAVDLPEGKNLVGAFYQPGFVMGNMDALCSLPARELRCGLAEMVKYAFIMDAEFARFIEDSAQELLDLSEGVMEAAIARCCRLKAGIVQADEKETGQRAILNYGHTFGHALEAVGGFRQLNHGEAVAIGMGMAADYAREAGMVSSELAERQDSLLDRLGLPTSFRGSDFSAEHVVDCMYRDKKVRRGVLRLVLPSELGRVELVEVADRSLLLEVIRGRIC